jgi:decaprenyl-phosphate phosphoribosyltransferase
MTEPPLRNVSLSERLRAHLAIARLDHSIKNLFVLPGVVVPLSVSPALLTPQLFVTLLLAFLSVTLVACSNYVINEVLDAPFDRLHPTKRNRPAARGLVNIPAAYAQWLLMMVAGIAIGIAVSRMFALVALVLWIMGCLYNFPPIRTKDVPYLDVLTESINNPLRMLLGWYAVTSVLVPPVSLLIAYWMLGCYFMGLKRFSELSEIGDRTVAGAFTHDSAVQNPEKLYREPLLMASFAATALVMGLLLFIRIPRLELFFTPTLPSTTPAVVQPAPVSYLRHSSEQKIRIQPKI